MNFNKFSRFFLSKNILIPKKVLRDNNKDKVKIIKTHTNDVQLIYFKNRNFYTKFSKNRKANKKIYSEFKGLLWYCKRRKLNPKNLIKNFYVDNNISYIDIQSLKGEKIKSWKPLSENYYYLKKIFKHYLKYFPKKKLVNIHGDLTLDNILIQKKNLFIIDWEFFKAKKSYYGYDIVYLFLSAACLPYLSHKKFSYDDEIYFRNLWKILIESKISNKLVFNPFVFFSNKIKNDQVLKKSYKISKSKFFPFITSKSHKKKIMKIIDSIKNEK